MAQEKLPWELVEEILYRVPRFSLIRFKTVCKQWNTLINDETFLKNHLAKLAPFHPQFLLWTSSKIIYSVGVIHLNEDHPVIEIRELPSDIPYLGYYTSANFILCDGLLFCASSNLNNVAAVWNPRLEQTKWIETEERFKFRGIGYDSGKPDKGLKIFGSSFRACSNDDRRLSIYEFETDRWKCIDALSEDKNLIGGDTHVNNVSLNGNLYWPAYYLESGEYIIQCFDFSKEMIELFCVLPWKKPTSDTPVLSVLRGDWLSVLNKSIETNEIEILVTKNKIGGDVENVVWRKFMTFSVPICSWYHTSYFIDINLDKEKKVVMCCSDKNRKTCLYIVRGNETTKVTLDRVGNVFNHRSYIPSLMPVP